MGKPAQSVAPDQYNKIITRLYAASSPATKTSVYNSVNPANRPSLERRAKRKIATMPPEQAENARKCLLAYCESATFAMVMVWQRLKELAED